MDAKLKAEWVKALRSGEYEQTVGYLKDHAGHCCLGVLCEVARRVGAINPKLIKIEPGEITVFDVDEDDRDVRFISELSGATRDAFGLRKEDETNLINRNDGIGNFAFNRQSFEQIADFIEAEVQ